MDNLMTSLQHLLVGRRIVGVDDDMSNEIILMLDDGSNVLLSAETIYIPGAGNIPKIQGKKLVPEPPDCLAEVIKLTRAPCSVCGELVDDVEWSNNDGRHENCVPEDPMDPDYFDYWY